MMRITFRPDKRQVQHLLSRPPNQHLQSRYQCVRVHAYSSTSSPTGRSPQPSSSPVSFKSNDPISSWEERPNWNIKAFSDLPHKHFGVNQHMLINDEFKESLRQIIWQFKAPIRYAFAYGSGVFSQASGPSTASLPSPHPNPPEAIAKWQQNGGKVIDFIFGVTYSDHWHAINLADHRDHYSFVGAFGSAALASIQDNWGAGVYFNPYITVNGTMIKYGVVNLDTIRSDLTNWDNLYLAGRLHKPVKILRDNPSVRLANQMNLISAIRTALLLLPARFSEQELYTAIAAISYTGDVRMSPYIRSENPNKVADIVQHQLVNFRQLYQPLVQDLPNLASSQPLPTGSEADAPIRSQTLEQDMSPIRRANIIRRLPPSFRSRLYRLYQDKFGITGGEFDSMMAEKSTQDGILSLREATSFDRRIGRDKELPDMVEQAIRSTISWPSKSQSLKGILTAGPVRSWRYLQEKRKKGKTGV